MRLATFIFIVSLFRPNVQTVLKGVISIDGETTSGCKVEVLETGDSQMTDWEGRFKVVVNDNDKVSLLVSYVDGLTCKVLIRDIKMNTDEVNLEIIPLFLNQAFSISDYEKLEKKEKEKYDQVRHWTKLIGYINEHCVDTIAVRIRRSIIKSSIDLT